MTTIELEEKIKELAAGRTYYTLNDGSVSSHTLRYNKQKHLWEYYFEDDRGGIQNYRTFSSEQEACDYVYKDAVYIINFYSRAVESSS